jgi:hypothetical protein
MTIAAGFCCSDGILLCADSQFTGAEKLHKPKLLFRSCREVLLAFGISGDPDYARSVIDDCCSEGLTRLPNPARSVWEVRKIIRRAIGRALEEYQKRGLPYDQRPQLLVTIASPHWGTWLFSTWQSAMPQVDGSHFLGTGSYIAGYLMQAFWPDVSTMTIEALVPFAMYMIAAAKRHDAYCGGGSQFMAIRGTDASGVFSAVADRSDEYFTTYEGSCGLLLSSLGDLSLTTADFDKQLRVFTGQMKQLRRTLSKDGSTYQGIVRSLRIQKRD